MENNLGEFLRENSGKTNKELSEDIRKARNLDNKFDNIVVHQFIKSCKGTASKMKSLLMILDKKSTIEIVVKGRKFKL